MPVATSPSVRGAIRPRSGGSIIRSVLAAALYAALPTSTALAAAADDAEPLVLEGIKFRTVGQDAKALQKFQQAYQIARTPRIVGQIGTAEQALGRWLDAETHITEALTAKTDAWVQKYRVPLEQALQTIRSHLGTLDIVGEPEGAEISVDGRASGRLPLASPLRLVAGQVLLQVRAAGYFPATRTVTVVAEQNARETIILQPNPAMAVTASVTDQATVATPPTAATDAATSARSGTAPDGTSGSGGSWHRPAGWAFAAGAGAGVIVGVVGVVVRNDKADKYNALAASTMCGGTSAAMCADLKSSGDSARTAAIIGFSAAGVFAVTSAILFFTAPPGESPSQTAGLDSCALLPTSRGISCLLRF